MFKAQCVNFNIFMHIVEEVDLQARDVKQIHMITEYDKIKQTFNCIRKPYDISWLYV